MKPTNEQRTAIETQDRPLLIEAGAGTGKTWVLVQRFLHLLTTNPQWKLESITAITFTEKAAREMRTRLRQEIEKNIAATLKIRFGKHTGVTWMAYRWGRSIAYALAFCEKTQLRLV